MPWEGRGGRAKGEFERGGETQGEEGAGEEVVGNKNKKFQPEKKRKDLNERRGRGRRTAKPSEKEEPGTRKESHAHPERMKRGLP